MGEYKTPGVYIKEKNAFGNSIVEVETAIPVFIGLTGAAQDGTSSLLNSFRFSLFFTVRMVLISC